MTPIVRVSPRKRFARFLAGKTGRRDEVIVAKLHLRRITNRDGPPFVTRSDPHVPPHLERMDFAKASPILPPEQATGPAAGADA
jgi:hypothetical protein